MRGLRWVCWVGGGNGLGRGVSLGLSSVWMTSLDEMTHPHNLSASNGRSYTAKYPAGRERAKSE